MDWLKKIDFAMTTDTGKVTFKFVLFAMILGFIISWIAIYCNKKIMGAFARAAMNAGAIDEESAKTLAELEQENNVSAINAMRRGGALSKMVTAVGAERDEKGMLTVDENTRFYISEEAKQRAVRQYGEKEAKLWTLILGIAAILAVGILLFLFVSPVIDALAKK